jgi:glucosamine 6-phosphate synthetase-like amidotransferase/phosphosugar isomerase protein
MCGIFGFALTKPVSMVKVFKLLEKLEVHQYPQEPRPVGGYGAGVAILLNDGSVLFEKVGKVDNSPARHLAKIVNAKVNEASVLVGHVRMPSPEFMESAKFKETAQPYVVELDPNLAIVSVHNGKVENYKELREKLGKEHVFESERVELIDSEVIPHYFEELLSETDNINEALYALFYALQGSNAIAMLQIAEENTFLHFIHKGKTRGLTVWTNGQGELIFCSRKEPLIQELNDTLVRGKFKEKVAIALREDVGLKLSFPVSFRVKG